MIDASLLLSTLQSELRNFVGDLNGRLTSDGDVRARMEAEWRSAFNANRTANTFEQWAEDRLTQVAVAWILAFVFIRFCEDNGLIDEAQIAGPGNRGTEAKIAQQNYFSRLPNSNDREYLQSIFRSSATLAGLQGVIGEGESPLWLVDPPADAVGRLITVFRTTDESGTLIHDFTDPDRGTRFLGDLYQDLSDYAKSTYALLQTPDFVEGFILDRTLTPAIETFGLANTTLIDPTCGSGHFLLGGFQRIFEAWRDAEPGGSEREHAQRALTAVTGVDLNPFAAAIARFRLLVAALKVSHIFRLADAPAFVIDVAVGDSLLWGALPGQFALMEEATTAADRQFIYKTEHADDLRRIFNKKYAAVVGNPPYIVCQDAALSQQYRGRYKSCYRQYSLGVPFTERFFDLAFEPDGLALRAGYVGMITANSFMKREFGKKLIEQFIPTWDLTHVIDTSGAYIPGHGTPTVILFGRHQAPVRSEIRTAMGNRGEPSVPLEPIMGLVWSSIVAQIDQPGSESKYLTVADSPRSRFASHPWSIGGGGASELKDRIEVGSMQTLESMIDHIGYSGQTNSDDVFTAQSKRTFSRFGVEASLVMPLIVGDAVRDWNFRNFETAFFPYVHENLAKIEDSPMWHQRLWPFRTTLWARATFSRQTYKEEGRPWHEWHLIRLSRLSKPGLVFSNLVSHNHFVLDRKGMLLNPHAPAVKLPQDATVEDHLALLGLLNSSTACFWMKQGFFNKGGPGEAWEQRYEFDGTKLSAFPIPSGPLPVDSAENLDALATQLSSHRPASICSIGTPTRQLLGVAHLESERIFCEMVAQQEELDWECLHLYGVTGESLLVPDGKTPPALNLGERAFEILLARKMARGEEETAWFARHGATPVTEIPSVWPSWYQDLVRRRIQLIENDRNVALIECPANKRRWTRESRRSLEIDALKSWLLDRLEDRRLWFEGSAASERAICRSVAQLADRVSIVEPDFLDVARLWKGIVEIDPVAVVAELIADEHVPAQSAARYKLRGLDKRRQWERTWELQRMEDKGEDLPDGLTRVPVPPRYEQTDFARAPYYKLRGKLDVPKERFTSVVGAEREADPTMVLAWAGFDHAQMAQAIGGLLVARQRDDGWDADRVWPLVVAMSELLPWLAQWHNEIDTRMGDSPAGLYRAFTEQQAIIGGRTLSDTPSWNPTATGSGR
jgi:hypothetical protein